MLSDAVGLQQLGNRLEDPVAGAIAELLVGLRQAVDVDHGHAQAGVIGHARPPGVQIGLDAGPIHATGKRVAAIGFFGRAAFLLGHFGQGLFQGVAEHVVGIQQAVRAADDLLAAAGQVAFVVEIGDFLAGGLDLGVLHLRGDAKLVVDAFPRRLRSRVRSASRCWADSRDST